MSIFIYYKTKALYKHIMHLYRNVHVCSFLTILMAYQGILSKTFNQNFNFLSKTMKKDIKYF